MVSGSGTRQRTAWPEEQMLSRTESCLEYLKNKEKKIDSVLSEGHTNTSFLISVRTKINRIKGFNAKFLTVCLA